MANDLSAVEIPIVAKDDKLKPAINTVNRLEREINRLIKATNNNSVSEERYRQTLIKTGRELKAVSQFTGNQAYGAVVKYANAKRRQMEASEQAAAAARREAMELKQATAEAARAAKAADDNTKSLNRLRASYDAQFATEQKVLTLKRALRTEVDNGRMSLAQADAEIIKYRQHLIAMTTAQTAVTKGNSKMGVLFQQTGYQVGDFAVQVQSGTHYMIALGQQATQLVGTFAMLSRSVKWVGIFSALGIAIPIITAVAGAFLRAGESADDAGKKVRTVSDILGDLAKATKDASNEMRLLGSEFKTALELETIDKIDELKAKILEVGDAMAEARRASLVGLGAAGGFMSGSELEKLAAASAAATSDEVISKRQEELKLEKERLETQLVYLQNERDLKLAAEALLEVQRKLDDITEATLDKSESLLEEFRQRSSLAQAYLANGEEGLKQEERLQEAMALVKELQSEKYNFSEAELDVILSQLKATYDLETAVDAAKESIKTAKEEARLLADALRAATTFSTNLDKEVDTLRARLAELKGDAGAMLRLTIQQREEEARSIAARSIAAGEDALVVNARLAIDLAQIQTSKELTEQIEAQTQATKRSGKAADEAAKAYERLVDEALKLEEANDAFLKFNNDLGHLNVLFDKGLISQRTYNKEVGKLQKALGDSIPYVNELSDAFTKFIMSGLKNFSDFVSSIKSMFVKMLSDMIATALRNKIIIPMVAGFTGNAASATAASAGSSILGTATGLSTFASSVGTGLSASLGTGGFASAGLFNVGANATAAAATGAGTIGATIGAALPVIGAVAAAISLFSKKVKELDAGFRLTANGADVLGESFSKIKTTRFWGLSKKITTEFTESDPLTTALSGQIALVERLGKELDLSTDKLADFTTEIQVSTKGLSEEQVAAKIQEAIAKFGDEAAAFIGGGSLADLIYAAEAPQRRLAELLKSDPLLGYQIELMQQEVGRLLKYYSKTFSKISDVTSENIGDIKNSIIGGFSVIEQAANRVRDYVMTTIGNLNEILGYSSGGPMGGLQKIGSTLELILNPAEAAISRLNSSYDTQIANLNAVRASGEATTEELRQMSDAAARTARSIAQAMRPIQLIRGGYSTLSNAIADFFAAQVDEGLNFAFPESAKNLSSFVKGIIGTVTEGSVSEFEGAFVNLADAFGEGKVSAQDFETSMRIMDQVFRGNISLTDQYTSKQQAAVEKISAAFERLNTSLQSVIDTVKSALQTLTGRREDLLQTTVGRDKALSYLRGVAATGQIPLDNQDRFNAAVQSVSQIETAGFSTATDMLRYIGQTSGVLRSIQDQAEQQLTDAEIQVQAILKIQETNQTSADALVSINAAIAEFVNAGGRVPQFASGGYHYGGLRVVGENGPELEATGPSRIVPSSRVSIGGGDSELRREIAELRVEMKTALVQIAKNTRKSSETLNKFDYQGLPANRGY